MNAVVALCHFCEHHGPCVMFCSEKGGIPTPVESTLETVPELSPSQEIPLGTSHPNSMISAEFSKPCSRQSSLKSSLCQACKSLPDEHKGYISCDNKAGDIFVSSQHPNDPNVFSKVRQACVRSLSCEVCPGKEGPIFFGDEDEGYVLSYTFFVKDSLARGFQRWYSIIVVMMDRIYLIQSWPFLVECIEKIKTYLQNCATSVYNSECVKCPQRSLRLKGKTVTPQNFRLNRSSEPIARALVELTGDKNLYSYLHASFTWMMRACKLRWKENTTYIPPTLEQIPPKIENACADEPYFTSLRHMREILQPPRFRAVVWHLLIGNQVIWYGTQSIVISAIRTLKEILPKGCVRAAEWTDVCAKDANLIGMENFNPNSVFKPWTKDYVSIAATQKKAQSFQKQQILDVSSVDIRLVTTCTIPEKGHSLFEKLDVALSNESLSNGVVQQCLLCLKQEWINKTKILQKFVLDKRNKEDTAHLLQDCLQCTDDDVKMMKYWLLGLNEMM